MKLTFGGAFGFVISLDCGRIITFPLSKSQCAKTSWTMLAQLADIHSVVVNHSNCTEQGFLDAPRKVLVDYRRGDLHCFHQGLACC